MLRLIIWEPGRHEPLRGNRLGAEQVPITCCHLPVVSYHEGDESWSYPSGLRSAFERSGLFTRPLPPVDSHSPPHGCVADDQRIGGCDTRHPRRVPLPAPRLPLPSRCPQPVGRAVTMARASFPRLLARNRAGRGSRLDRHGRRTGGSVCGHPGGSRLPERDRSLGAQLLSPPRRLAVPFGAPAPATRPRAVPCDRTCASGQPRGCAARGSLQRSPRSRVGPPRSCPGMSSRKTSRP